MEKGLNILYMNWGKGRGAAQKSCHPLFSQQTNHVEYVLFSDRTHVQIGYMSGTCRKCLEHLFQNSEFGQSLDVFDILL